VNWVIDILLGLLLIGYLISGFRRGFFRSIFTIVGVLAGGVAAFFVVPLVGGWVPDAAWRTIASVGVVIALLLIGHAIGAAIGGAVGRAVQRGPLRVVDRALGGILNLVVSALVISLLAASVAPLGVPLLSQAVGQSVVISTINRYTPDPVESFLAQARSIAVTDTIPSIVGAIGDTSGSPTVPDVDTQTDPLREAAASVVRITGNAYQCGQNQSGTGFVVAPDRVVTNAHVVAGVTEPVVELPGGFATAGRIVYFDPVDDLAVIAVNGLDAKPLALSALLQPGDEAVYDGYPFGGPFTTGPAEVIDVGSQPIEDIYGEAATPRSIYTLAADIQQGDSGGPLLTPDGTVAGVVFAKSASTASVGYAMTVEELAPVVALVATLTDAASSGTCIRG
jgi:S1-C subfamily serine protease